MILVLDENHELQLTPKALMVGAFEKLLFHYKEDKQLAMSAFTFLHYMYVFDSHFLWEYKEEKERIKEVKAFIPRGSELKIDRTLRKAMDIFMDLYNRDTVQMYIVMRKNVLKLRDYADRMVLFQIPLKEGEEQEDIYDIENMPILVDSKEFTMINSMLPKQQKDLEDFEIRLVESAKDKIDIYGGGKAGAYEH